MRIVFPAIILLIPLILFGQREKKQDSVYKFEDKYVVPTTNVKNQQRTGTCWSFATTSFIESELLRSGKGAFDLSEMFFVRYTYQQKAEDYVRYHGHNNFSEGGQAHDVLNVIEKYGFITEENYTGLSYGENRHIHTEMVAMISGMLKALIKIDKLTLTSWQESVDAILNIYLGEVPETFSVEEEMLSPVEFAEKLEFNTKEYLEFTSYTNMPFYEKFILKIPDNWSRDQYYNLPMDDMIKTFDYALENGYTVCWDGDVSEKEFSHSNGVAILPAKKFQDKTEDEQNLLFKQIEEEEKVTQELRQSTFDNYTTTDDHLMHITGIAFDQKGNKYYKTKNSWGVKSNNQGGYLYMSEAYIKLKTVAFLIHKDAVPADISNKLK